MAQSLWLTLRQAREAVANRRPDEAHRLIEPLVAEGYRKAWKAAREVVLAYVERANQFLDQHNPDAAWRDLLAAESLNTGEKAVATLRLMLARLGLVQTRASLEAGNPIAVVATVGKLRDRGVRHPDLMQLEEAAQDWVQAVELADRGEFLRALAELDKLRMKLPCPPAGVDRVRAAIEERQERFRAALGRLYDAAEARQWRDALNAAEEVLHVAPDHREAKALRGKAWLAAAPGEEGERGSAGEGESGRMGEAERGRTGAWLVDGVARNADEHRAAATTRANSALRYPAPAMPVAPSPHFPISPSPQLPLSHSPTLASTPLPKRFLLWVDGVGGYLVCLSNRVTFGQATADGPIDVPLFADVSRLHAEISRDNEGYVVESTKAVLVNGKEATRGVLSAGDRVTLGATCQFLFHKPVALSSTARLQLTSGHRLPVAVDGVLLMGNELMLGPGPNAHVILAGLTAPVLIYRSKEGLGVRVPGLPFKVDDRRCTDRAALPLPSCVEADAFSFSVEPVTGRL